MMRCTSLFSPLNGSRKLHNRNIDTAPHSNNLYVFALCFRWLNICYIYKFSSSSESISTLNQQVTLLLCSPCDSRWIFAGHSLRTEMAARCVDIRTFSNQDLQRDTTLLLTATVCCFSSVLTKKN